MLQRSCLLFCLTAYACVLIYGCGVSAPSTVMDRDGGPSATHSETGRVTMNAVRVPDGTIIIDGRTNDWTRIGPAALLRCEHIPGPEMWCIGDESRGKYFGRDDCSVVLHFAHDTDNLYILAQVRDQALFNTARPEEPNLGDDLELFIDANAPGERFAETKNDNVRQIILVPGNVNPAWRETFVWQSDKSAGKPRAASRLTPGGYVMEIAIPKASFPYWKDHPDLDAIGIDGIVCDADAPGAEVYHPAIKGALFLGCYASHFVSPKDLSLLTLEKEPVILAEDRAATTPMPPTAEQVLSLLAASGPPTRTLAGPGGLPVESPFPPSPGAEALAQAVLDLIDDPRAGDVAAAAVNSRSHLVAKAGMMLLARRSGLPLPESMTQRVLWLAGRKNPDAVAATAYGMEALAVRGKFPIPTMHALAKSANDPTLSITFLYSCGLNGDKAATPLLVGILRDDPNFRMRVLAALALGMLQDPAALDALREATTDKTRDVTYQARDAIQKIESHSSAP